MLHALRQSDVSLVSWCQVNFVVQFSFNSSPSRVTVNWSPNQLVHEVNPILALTLCPNPKHNHNSSSRPCHNIPTLTLTSTITSSNEFSCGRLDCHHVELILGAYSKKNRQTEVPLVKNIQCCCKLIVRPRSAGESDGIQCNHRRITLTTCFCYCDGYWRFLCFWFRFLIL